MLRNRNAQLFAAGYVFIVALMLPANANSIFSNERVPAVDLVLDAPAQAILSSTASNRTYVRGSLRIDGMLFENVGIRLKGRRTFQPLDRKPSLAVKLDEFAEQSVNGTTKLLFNNSTADPTFLREFISNELIRKAGIPAPRVGHALLKLNGRSLGLYVVVEGINKSFLRQHFPTTAGTLYEGALQDIDGKIEQDGGRDRSRTDLLALLTATREQEPEKRFALLRESLDIDQFASFLAMEQLLGQVDGYATQANNYRIYNAGRMTFFTHGPDMAFSQTNVALMPPLEKILAKAVLQTHEGRALYRKQISTLFRTVYDSNDICERIRHQGERLLSISPAHERAALRSNIVSLCEVVRQRAEHIAAGLNASTLKELVFGPTGEVCISDWRPGKPSRARMEIIETNGKSLLWIDSRDEFTTAAFRTSVLLDCGSYSLRSKLQTREVQPLSSARAERPLLLQRNQGGGVRIYPSISISTNFIVGSIADCDYQLDFKVEYGPQEVELFCELNRSKGQVWFDQSSFRLMRQAK